MINLSTQINIILYSFLYGLLFYYLLYLCRHYLNYKKTFFRIINTFTFFTSLSLIFFIGLQIVCDGILHIYSLSIVILSGLIEHFIAKKKI